MSEEDGKSWGGLGIYGPRQDQDNKDQAKRLKEFELAALGKMGKPLPAFVKHDQEKPRFDLIPPEVELELAKVFEYGGRKYSDNNYRLGTRWGRYVAAARRHLNAWQLGENNDAESGFSHLAQAIASLSMLLVLQLTGKGEDDRVK